MTHRPFLGSALAALLCLVALLPASSRADFGDCTDDGYLGRFPEASTALGLNCIELFRVTFATPAGERTIRGIQDISADWAFLPGAPEAVERGAHLTAAAFALLGSFEIDDVTLLILDDVHPTALGDGREVQAVTDGRRTADGAPKGECLITLYLLGRGGDPDELAVTVAHEIFHCLQYASLTTGQMATVGAGGDWWIEGTAEYFAALAVPESLRFTDRGGAFDSAVESGFALNGLRHEAVIFFYWLHQQRGPSGMLPFMRGMATSGDAPAQHAAMRSQMPDEEWLSFAQDYADRAIGHPKGGALSLSPPDGEVLVFDENETLDFPLPPFVISLGWADYDCGRWRNTTTPDNANVSAQEDGSRAWGDFPDEVDARSDPPGRYRIAGLHTGSEERTFEIEAERTLSCAPCGDSDRVDACLVGSWMMSGGGPIEWMKRLGVPITSAYSGPRIVTFRGDGVYGTEPSDTGLTLRDRDFVGRGSGFVTVAAGRWSAGDGQLTICQDSGGMSGTATVTTRHGTRSFPVSQPGAGQLSQTYSCSESSLSTTWDVPDLAARSMPPMVTHYSKLPEIPAAGAD